MQQKLQRQKGVGLSEEFVWDLLIQLLRGLTALHRLNIIHRDIKPSNVFLFSNGVVKLGDLGISKVAQLGLLYTQTGTPDYASPEVWKDHPYTTKSDIWSLGCVAYHAVTLKPPFPSEDLETMAKRICSGKCAPLSLSVSQDLKEVIGGMMQVDPAKRPSCDEVLRTPALYRRVPYAAGELQDSRLLDPMYLSDFPSSLQFPPSRYSDSPLPSLPRLHPQMASIHRYFHPSPARLSPEKSFFQSQRSYKRQSTRNIDLFTLNTEKMTANKRCEEILASCRKSKAVIDMLKRPNSRRKPVIPYAYGQF